MTDVGSLQLQRYRSARKRGATVMTACAESGIAMAEARIIEADGGRDAPSPTINPAAPAAQPKEPDMANARRKAAPITGEVAEPDFDLALKLYREDIKPAIARAGEHNQEASTAYKAMKKQAHVQPGAAKAAFKLDGMEESKRDDWLRSFNGLLQKLRIFMPVDLVDAAEGKGGTADNVVPTGQRPRPQLATVPTGPAGDQDLVDAAEPAAAE